MALPGIVAIESAALTVWPGLLTAHDGLWVWRAARGYSNRANSFQCLDPSDGLDAAVRVGRMSALFVRHGLPPVFKVTPLTAPEILGALDVIGWVQYGASHVMSMEMRAQTAAPLHHTALFDPLDPDWHAAQAEMSGYDAHSGETVRLILARVACDQRGILAYDKSGVPVTAVLAAVAGGIAMYGNVVTRPGHRGQGFGRAAMAAALGWSRDAGATSAAIQVAADNEPAIKLYASLGFAPAYDYHYRKPRSPK